MEISYGCSGRDVNSINTWQRDFPGINIPGKSRCHLLMVQSQVSIKVQFWLSTCPLRCACKVTTSHKRMTWMVCLSALVINVKCWYDPSMNEEWMKKGYCQATGRKKCFMFPSVLRHCRYWWRKEHTACKNHHSSKKRFLQNKRRRNQMELANPGSPGKWLWKWS